MDPASRNQRPGTLRRVALCLCAVVTPRAAAQLQLLAASSPTQAQLVQQVNGFELTAGAAASMRDINGGRMCVDGSGYEPPGYELRGPLDLSTCAQLAQQQPSVVGFRWGRTGFNTQAYNRYAMRGILPLGTPVQLDELFNGKRNFTCVIYMVNEDGEAPDFQETDLTRQFGYRTEVEGSADSNGKNGGVQDNTFGYYKKPKSVEGQAGSDVCSQRWTLTKFFEPYVTEMWFCYTPVTRFKICQDQLHNFRVVQGLLFLSSIAAMCVVLSLIMKKQRQFTWALLWGARFLVNMQLGLAAVALLLQMGVDSNTDDAKFFMLALILVIGFCNIIFLPFICFETGSSISVFYLMLLLFSGPVVAEVMSYYPAFPLLVSHRPMLLGALGFMAEVAKVVLLGDVSVPKGETHALAGNGVYTRMYPSGV